MILPDHELTKWATNGGVFPFETDNINPASIDLRIGNKYINLTTDLEFRTDNFLLHPGQAILATTVEYIKMPNNCAGVLYLKSSMARLGLDHALAGFVDPNFEGELTMELHAHRSIKLVAGQRVIQLVLYRMETPPLEGYDGRYQGQRGPTQARE